MPNGGSDDNEMSRRAGLLDGPILLDEDCFAFIERGERHTVRNASDSEPAECISVLRRV